MPLPRTALLTAWAAGLWSASCAADRTPEFVPLDTSEMRYRLFSFFDASGHLTRISSPELVPEGENPGDSPIRLAFEEDEIEVVLLGLSQAELDAHVPLLDQTRPESLGARFGAWVCGTRDLDYEAHTVHIPVPPSATLLLHRLGGAGFHAATPNHLEAVRSMALRFPIDFGLCLGPSKPKLSPFGSAAFHIPPGATVGGVSVDVDRDLIQFRAIARVDDRRVVALSRDTVFLLEKDVPYQDTPSLVVHLAPSFGTMVKIAIDRRPGLASRSVFVSGGRDGGRGAYHELVLSNEGLRMVRSATTTEGSRLNDIMVDAQGRMVAVADDGLLWTKRPEDTEPQSFHLALRLQAVAPSPDPARPHALAAPDKAFLGDAFTRVFDTYASNALGLGLLELNSITSRSTETELELWVGGKAGWVGRTRDGRLDQVHLDWSEEWLSCTSGIRACGVAALSHVIVELEADPRPGAQRLYMLADYCDGAVIAVDDARGCATSLRPPPDELDSPVQLRAIEIHDGWLTAAGDRGRIYETRL